MKKKSAPPKPYTAARKLDAIGIEAICARLIAGETQTEISKDAGVSIGALIHWIAADNVRSARAREARIMAAGAYSDMAEAELRAAADPFELAKARELASHFRWKASKANPGEYGDRIQTEISGELSVKKSAADLSDEELAVIASRKQDKTGAESQENRPAIKKSRTKRASDA